MSLYTFATDNLTTFADLRRRPAIDKGQLQRILALVITFAIAFGLTTHHRNAGTQVPPEASIEDRTIVQ